VIRRSARILFEVVGAVIAGGAILVGLAAWRLSTAEPIQLRFLTPYLERALNAPDGSFRVSIGATVLAWRGWSHALDLDARDVSLYDGRGSRIAAVPEIMVSLSGRALLQGIVAPQRITAVRPNIYLLRDADGRLHFMRWHDSQAPGTAPGVAEESPILPAIVRTLSQPPQGMVAANYITDLVLSDGTLTFEDRRGGIVWKAPHVTIELKRGSGGIAGHIQLVVDRLGTPARLKADFAYDAARGRVSVDAGFSDVDALALGLLEPQLLEIATLDAKLQGRISTEIGIDGTVGMTRFTLGAGPGTIVAPDRLDKPLAVQSLDLRGRAAPGFDSLDIEVGQLQLDGPRIAFSGQVSGLRPAADGAERPLSLFGRVAADGIAVERLAEFWPRGVGQDARDWTMDSVSQGRVDHLEAVFDLDLPATGEPLIRRFDGGFRASGVTVSYLKPLPPIRGADGVARFDEKTFDVDVTGGQSAGVTLRGGTVHITGLDKKEQHIVIRGHGEGDLRQVLRLLDHPPLGYVSKVGLDPEQVEGRVAADLSAEFPAHTYIGPKDIVLKADAKLTDVALGRGMFGRHVEGGRLKLALDNSGMTLSGDARCEDVPVTLTWREQFKADAAFESRFDLQLTADAAARARLGFDLRPYVDGTIPMKLVYTRLPAQRSILQAELGLERATLTADFVAWRKPAGEPGRAALEVEFRGEHPVAVRSFSVQAGSLVAAGNGVFAQKGPQLDRLRLDRLAFANTKLSAVELDLAGSTPVITIGSGQIDASPLLEAENPVKPVPEELANKPTQPFELRAARLDRVILGGDRAITNVAVTLRHDAYYWDRILLDATLPGGTALGVRYKARADRRHDLEIVSADAGDLLRTFDVTDKVTGGRLQISGMANDAAPNRPLSGTAEITNFRLTKTPFLVRLLSIATLTGLIDVLTGEGFQFDRFRADFTKTAGLLTVGGARASGPSLGFTGDGFIDLDHSRLDMRGTIVPVYLLNNLLGKIPVIGNLLIGGNGQGLFAVTYRASGALDEPDLSVNPLTVLAPGFLRNLFQAQVPQASPAPAAGPQGAPGAPGPATSAPAPTLPSPPMHAPGVDR
jgi:hypothetical protein